MRYLVSISLIFALLMVGCAGMQTSPENIGATLSSKYIELYNQYQSTYKTAGKQQREFMREELAPQLDRARDLLMQYNRALLNNRGAVHTKLELIKLLKQITAEMPEASNAD